MDGECPTKTKAMGEMGAGFWDHRFILRSRDRLRQVVHMYILRWFYVTFVFRGSSVEEMKLRLFPVFASLVIFHRHPRLLLSFRLTFSFFDRKITLQIFLK